VRSRAEKTVPDSDGQHDDEEADHENGGQPVRRFGLVADSDHDPGDITGAAGLGAPEAVPVGGEDEFPLGVGAAAHCRLVRVGRGEGAHFSVRHRFAVRGRELRRDLVCCEKIDCTGWQCEKLEGYKATEQERMGSARPSN